MQVTRRGHNVSIVIHSSCPYADCGSTSSCSALRTRERAATRWRARSAASSSCGPGCARSRSPRASAAPRSSSHRHGPTARTHSLLPLPLRLRLQLHRPRVQVHVRAQCALRRVHVSVYWITQSSSPQVTQLTLERVAHTHVINHKQSTQGSLHSRTAFAGRSERYRISFSVALPLCLLCIILILWLSCK